MFFVCDLTQKLYFFEWFVALSLKVKLYHINYYSCTLTIEPSAIILLNYNIIVFINFFNNFCIDSSLLWILFSSWVVQAPDGILISILECQRFTLVFIDY